MQPVSAHNPPPEDVEDGDDLRPPSGSGDQLGISVGHGLKIGNEGASQQYGASSVRTYYTAEIDPDYINNDYIFEEGNSNSKFMETLSEFINNPQLECPDSLLTHYHRFFTIIVLKSCLFNTVNSIVGGNASHNAYEKIAASLKIVVDEVLNVLTNKKENEKDREKAFIREAVTDFFAALMDVANLYLVKRYRQEINDLFLSDNFFQMSRRNLRKWCKIINHFISDHKDAVFESLLYYWNTQAGLLTSKETENKQKVIALKRVSFLVFSGNVDQYDDKLDLLLKKMTEGLKMSTTKKLPELQRQLFLLTRVLLLRL
jgi:hypothetical protein